MFSIILQIFCTPAAAKEIVKKSRALKKWERESGTKKKN
jgi:hypothetical protein